MMFISASQILSECLQASEEVLRENEPRMWAAAQEIARTVPPEAAYTDPAVRQAARDLELEWGIADPYFTCALAWMVEQVGKGRLRELEA